MACLRLPQSLWYTQPMFKSLLFSNFKIKFWGIILGLIAYALIFVFLILPALGTSGSLSLYFLFQALYFAPALWLLLLGLYSLFQAYKQERTWLNAFGHFVLSLIFGVLFIPFFLLVTFSIFGFS